MGDDLKKVQPGDKLRVPAAAYNAFVDAAVDLRRRQQNLSIDGNGSPPASPGIVPVRNDSGEDVERFHILAIDGPLFEPEDSDDQAFKNSTALIGVKPDEDTPRGQFVIAREPIKAGAVGQCIVHGVTPARVLIEDEDDSCADIRKDETVLVSTNGGGTPILWKEDGTGEKWAVVEIGRPPRDRFVAILGAAQEIEGQRFRWRYAWTEARVDGDPDSETYGKYLKVEDGLSSGADVAKHAINRFENHHTDDADYPEGTDGFAGMKALVFPGILENPDGDDGYIPPKAAVPMIRPVLKGVAVEITVERDSKGKSVFAFQANNPMELTEMTVPADQYA